MRYKWRYLKGDRRGYAVTGTTSKYNMNIIQMHSHIMNCPKGLVVDHIDGNGLNNTKENLRICTREQNAINRHKNTVTAHKYKGIFKKRGRFAAQIFFNNEKIYLGEHDTQEQAAMAYDRAAIRIHKEFANLNFKDYNYAGEVLLKAVS